MKDHSLGRKEKLKSDKIINSLFQQGKSLFSFPIKMVFINLPAELGSSNHQFSVSIPKKKFKKAVDRNRIKRLIREAYRTNKAIIANIPPKAMMAIYVSDKELTYKEVERSIKNILTGLSKANKES